MNSLQAVTHVWDDAEVPVVFMQLIVILGFVAPPFIWFIRKVQAITRENILAHQKREEFASNMEEVKSTMASLDSALRQHMSSEERTNARIEEVGNTLTEKLEVMDRNNATSHLTALKATWAISDKPVNIAEVWPGGYQYIWANEAFLRLTNLTIDEIRTPDAIFMSIAEPERELVRSVGETIGQAGEDFDGEYTLVDARTQIPKGKVKTHGHFIRGAGDRSYYLATVTPLWSESEPTG